MEKIKHYLNDGANHQARAVVAYLSVYGGIENSWNDESKRYMAEPQIHRWQNCREQGYVIMLRNAGRQLNIIFFEHRNSDSICAVKWEQHTFPNPPTIETAEFGDVYKDKFDVSHEVEYGQPAAMADWIYEQLEIFWDETSK